MTEKMTFLVEIAKEGKQKTDHFIFKGESIEDIFEFCTSNSVKVLNWKKGFEIKSVRTIKVTSALYDFKIFDVDDVNYEDLLESISLR
ncbi:hypothetical protein [Endozoicomonas atrinae]|uniref:hypothetical protein n=1 Tax=Endozoicomonas atrinae TaxID=1333660 RepID=UPI000824DFE9|nr:hypothetical protein [Endozoicomonas atrinae]